MTGPAQAEGRVPPLELAGGVLAAVVIVLWGWGHLRLRRHVLDGRLCPQCGQDRWRRIHRSLPDHFFGLGVKVRRYQCRNCNWEGLRRRHD